MSHILFISLTIRLRTVQPRRVLVKLAYAW